VEQVVVVGAGPTGLWLACELALAGVDTLVVERAAEGGPHSKALGMHARTLEVLAMRGLAEEFLASGRPLPNWHYAMLRSRLDLQQLRTAFPFMLAIPQARTEELLEERAAALGVRIRRGTAVTDLDQDADGVTLRLGGEEALRAEYIVGCDGAGSTVRKAAGVGFPGSESPGSGFLGDVALDAPPPPGFGANNAEGALIVAPLPDGRFRVTGYDPNDQDDAEQTLDRLRATAVRIAGSDFGMRDPVWLSRFGLAARQADRYRAGRVLLAGDAAHMHPPAGGVGLNAGIQDAMNLGWKLAAVVQGRAGAGLLESYDAERHPVGAALLAHTQAQTALIMATSPDGLALRATLEALIATHTDLAHTLANTLTALDVSYPPVDPGAHPVVGTRVADGALFPLLHAGTPVLVDVIGSERHCPFPIHTGPLDEPGWTGVTAALVRPDGHVAWATDAPPGPQREVALATAVDGWPYSESG
jgi:2-polyprenyl-6-methoxyphenol hydroxylase-like FAD-dependent oxidoreductase